VYGTKRAYEAIRREWRGEVHKNEAMRLQLDEWVREVEKRDLWVSEEKEESQKLRRRTCELEERVEELEWNAKKNQREVVEEPKKQVDGLKEEIEMKNVDVSHWRRRALSAEALLKKKWDERERKSSVPRKTRSEDSD